MQGATIFDRFDTPPIAVLLGWRLLEADTQRRYVKVEFHAKPEFCNPAGFIQGGMLSAMLDDTLGPAVLVASEGRAFTSTITLSTSYLAPARPGRLVGEATVLKMGRTIAFIEGRLMDDQGAVLATATASARLVSTDRIPAR